MESVESGMMTGTLAIASVTAVLRSLLENGLVERSVTASVGGDALVSALPPDRIATGADERPQINLFLYHVTPHTGLRTLRSTTHAQEQTRAVPAALALDLHYVVTAYGAQDFQIEILLGYAIQLLHSTGTITRDMIHLALTSLSSPEHGGVLAPAVAALASSNLAAQVAQITVTPQFLSTEELSRLWSALQARYRPSAAYKVSMVLIEEGA